MAILKKKYGVKRTYKKKASTKAMDKHIKKVALKAIKPKLERKSAYADLQVNLDCVSPTVAGGFGSLQQLDLPFALSQGAGEGQRIGNRITPTSWRIKGVFSSSVSTSVACMLRCVIFRFKHNYFTPTSSTDIFDTGVGANGVYGNLKDIFAPLNTDVYKILYDKVYKCGPSISPYNNDFKTVNSFNIDLLKLTGQKLIEYSDGISLPVNTSIFMMTILGNPDGGTGVFATNATPNMSYVVTGSFTDS